MLKRIAEAALVAATVAVCGVLSGGCAHGNGGTQTATQGVAGPVVAWDETVQGDERFRAAGPFYENRSEPDGTVERSFRPFYSHVSDPTNQNEFTEYLWPIASYRTTRGQSNWRVALAYGHNFDVTDENSAKKTVVFPIYYSGVSKEAKSYAAIFPLGGTIIGFLTIDRFEFVLWPIFSKVWKDDIEGTHILWPIITWAKGKDVKRFRVFPFYAVSRNGEDCTKRFVQWPFWSSVT